jgi:hypothetical protein
MNHDHIIQQLSKNKGIFKEFLNGLSKEEYLWKPSPEKWCLLEIICHLYDEEREDFRQRTKHVLETPEQPLPMFDQIAWVLDRKYIQQDYSVMLAKFLKEREWSVEWLKSLKNSKWSNAYEHPKLGQITAGMFLANWLAHDYLHMRQLIKLKFDYLKQSTNESLTYAGNW